MDWSILFIIIQLIFIEALLSIDNAAVLGAMVVHLPTDRPIEWPRGMKRLGDALHPLLGNQRTAALRVGLLGAYTGQAMMLLLASLIIRNPWLKLVGAAYLVRLAFDNLGQAEPGEEDPHVRPIEASSFWHIVVSVELADLAFSLDNVVAAVSISEKLWVVMLGVAIAILLMRFAAGLFSKAIEHEPVLKTAAYILVLNIGIQLILDEVWGIELNDWVKFGLSIAIILLCLIYANVKFLRVLKPALLWLALGFGNINEVIDWALVPVIGLIKLVFRGLRWAFAPLYHWVFPVHEGERPDSVIR